ncbi:hypothetical protein BC833DRAFT_618469 [Globomyces pollinis-pini]|nr:hypothetical protein BC833DRAFT_618469 [Globomyces pollinis-pini]
MKLNCLFLTGELCYHQSIELNLYLKRNHAAFRVVNYPKPICGCLLIITNPLAYSDDLSKHILDVMKDSAMDRLTNCDEDRTKLIINKAVFSQRQAAEWGMGTIQRTFGRLKSPLPLNNRKRLTIVKAVVLLHNFRTKYVGFNQIQTVYAQ